MLQHYLDGGRRNPSMRMKDLGWLENIVKKEEKSTEKSKQTKSPP